MRRKSIPPWVSDDGSLVGSAITNRAIHSASASFSNQRPPSAGPAHGSHSSDVPGDHGPGSVSPSTFHGPRQAWEPLPRRSTPRLAHSVSRLAAENRAGRASPAGSEPRQFRLSTESADEMTGSDGERSRLHPRPVQSSPASTAGPVAAPTPTAKQRPAASRPRGSRSGTTERLSYGQESARGLSFEQKPAGGLSAVAGGTASHGTFLQPDTHPITEEQLINEVRGIYAGLVMVEKKCIEIDKEQSESNSELSHQQWQTLISLHRTLLQEHHDFFMASQHPSASPVLTRLSEKYAMPARMWRYGIHAFLELLRHRLPGSLDHMLTFIYLAYSMMTLLMETVPAFEETWIECLGDLSRYRMAVEEVDLRDREVWAGVARNWYNQAADRNPDVGRIQHHLAVLARPDIVQQLFYYTRSLVSVRSFAGTRESILLLFNPILKGPRANPHHMAAISFVAAHGRLFTGDTAAQFAASANEFLSVLDKHVGRVGSAFKMQGVHMTAANIASMLQYSGTDSLLSAEFHHASQHPRSLEAAYMAAAEHWIPVQNVQQIEADMTALESLPSPLPLVFYGSYLAFKSLSVFLDQLGDKNIFPAVHSSLAFLWCLALTTNGMKHVEAMVPWERIVTFLNTMVRPWVDMALVEQPEFPISEDTRWLPEDFLMRGQLWSQYFYPPAFFVGSPTEDDGRNVERPSTGMSRTYRCLWLGVRLATVSCSLPHYVSSKRWPTNDYPVQSLVYVRPNLARLLRNAFCLCAGEAGRVP